MRYTLSFLQADYSALTDHLFGDTTTEQAAYLICGVGVGGGETRLMVREVISVAPEDVIEASRIHMRIRSQSYMRATKRADLDNACFVFVHSHPNGLRWHSDQDDGEEATLFRSAYTRIATAGPHASIVFSTTQTSSGRV